MTLFDIVAVIVVLVSALVGLSRGIVRELVSLFAFGLAVMASVFLLPLTAPIARHMVHPSWAANAVAIVVVFLIAYVAVRVLGAALSRMLRGVSTLGFLDRGVGLGFGVARGLLMLGVFYLVFRAVPSGMAPRWVSDAKLYPLSRACGQTVAAIAPDGLKAMGGAGQVLKTQMSKGVTPDSAPNDSSYDGSAPPATHLGAVYDPYTLRRDARVRHHRTPAASREPVQVE